MVDASAGLKEQWRWRVGGSAMLAGQLQFSATSPGTLKGEMTSGAAVVEEALLSSALALAISPEMGTPRSSAVLVEKLAVLMITRWNFRLLRSDANVTRYHSSQS